MFEICGKEALQQHIIKLELRADDIAFAARPGQFVMVRAQEGAERIPLTIFDVDVENGTIALVIQAVGASTMQLCEMSVGQYILDVAGPLGEPTQLEDASDIVFVLGGVGCAVGHLLLKQCQNEKRNTTLVLGFQSEQHIILYPELSGLSQSTFLYTQDGSCGLQGNVVDGLQQVLVHQQVDLVVCIGPLAMMQAVARLTRAYGIKTLASLNPIMIDGTGMCGGCRCSVYGEMRFACVEGPDFDAHGIDFEELMHRNAYYKTMEHTCRLRAEGEFYEEAKR
ncbi:MAG: sulfide/dihydroorotate dehydrogenase-like FAD/NAD-binding protein [Erysipelotrichaceae bacterium]